MLTIFGVIVGVFLVKLIDYELPALISPLCKAIAWCAGLVVPRAERAEARAQWRADIVDRARNREPVLLWSVGLLRAGKAIRADAPKRRRSRTHTITIDTAMEGDVAQPLGRVVVSDRAVGMTRSETITASAKIITTSTVRAEGRVQDATVLLGEVGEDAT